MKNVLIPVLAFVTGGVAGFLIARGMLEEKYANLAQDKIDDFEARYRVQRGSKATVETPGMKAAKEYVDDGDMDKDVYKEYVQKSKTYKKPSSLAGTKSDEINRQKVNYNAYSTPSKPTDEEDSEDDGEHVYKQGEEPPDESEGDPIDHPYSISEESMSEDFLHFEKANLTYYALDDVLIYENENLVDNVDMLVGYDNLDSTADFVWVRNEMIGTDYEIEIRQAYYQEEVLGLAADTKYMNGVKNKRRKREEDDE